MTTPALPGDIGEMRVRETKLTPHQLRVLTEVEKAADRGLPHRVYTLGRGTCEALRKRGLVCTHDERNLPFNRLDGNPYVLITKAGRSALKAKAES